MSGHNPDTFPRPDSRETRLSAVNSDAAENPSTQLLRRHWHFAPVRDGPLIMLLKTPDWLRKAQKLGAELMFLQSAVIPFHKDKIGIVVSGSVRMHFSDGAEFLMDGGDFFNERETLGIPLPAGVDDADEPTLTCMSEACNLMLLKPGAFWRALDAMHPSHKWRCTQVTASYAMLRKTALFDGFSDYLIYGIAHAAEKHLFTADQRIIEEGDTGDWMGLLLEGTAKVEHTKSTGHSQLTSSKFSKKRHLLDVLKAGSVFRELAALGVFEKQTASITAEYVCVVITLKKALLTKLCATFPEDGDSLNNLIKERLIKLSERRTLWDLPIFQSCSPAFVNYLHQSLQVHLFEKNHVICQENAEGDSMYVIQHGLARIATKAGATVKMLKTGDYFGEQTVLGLSSKRTATVIAEDMCLVNKLEKETVSRALNMFPADLARFVSLAKERLGNHFDNLQPWQQLPFFAECSTGFLMHLEEMSEDLIVMSEQKIVNEGDEADSILVLLEGSISVCVMGTVVREISAPPTAIFGEFSLLLGWPSRTATLSARSTCWMKRLHTRSVQSTMLTQFPDECQKFEHIAATHLYSLPPSGTVYLNVPIFAASPSRFLYLLDLYSERRVYYTNDVVLEPTSEYVPLFVILRGAVSISEGDKEAGTLKSGEVFGEIKSLNISSGKGSKIVCESCATC
eukprot:GEMP01001083.1.p2 GENE.GEMP01001083.1~~GEMP01001083.1.p2  ORF type:complete len:694 (+),score=131.49 GEMP01001083.1:39-2084(+)